jgi:hypothetical protein
MLIRPEPGRKVPSDVRAGLLLGQKAFIVSHVSQPDLQILYRVCDCASLSEWKNTDIAHTPLSLSFFRSPGNFLGRTKSCKWLFDLLDV